jgi:galactokinase
MQLTKNRDTTLAQEYAHLFSSEAIYARSPGRINIIGEHTDYNNGFVLPAAIDKAAYVAVEKRTGSIIRLISSEYKEEYSCIISDIRPVGGWPDYVLGVVSPASNWLKLRRRRNILLPACNAVSWTSLLPCSVKKIMRYG